MLFDIVKQPILGLYIHCSTQWQWFVSGSQPDLSIYQPLCNRKALLWLLSLHTAVAVPSDVTRSAKCPIDDVYSLRPQVPTIAQFDMSMYELYAPIYWLEACPNFDFRYLSSPYDVAVTTAIVCYVTRRPLQLLISLGDICWRNRSKLRIHDYTVPQPFWIS